MAWYDYVAIAMVSCAVAVMLFRQLACTTFELRVDVDTTSDTRTGTTVCRARLGDTATWPAAARPDEMAILYRAWAAAEQVWPRETWRQHAAGWRLWLVRSAEDYVVFDKPRRWADACAGHGGLRFFGIDGPAVVCVAAYDPWGSLDALLVHELTHLLSGIVPHNEEFHRLEIEFRRIYDNAS